MFEAVTAGIALSWLVKKAAEEVGTRTFEAVIKDVMERRADSARSIAIEEITAGRGDVLLDAPRTDEFVAIVWRYLRAAEEGAARTNLRLMAAVIAGKPSSPPLYASEFLRWSDLVASLSEAEIVLLATLHRECTIGGKHTGDHAARRSLIPRHFLDDEDFNLTGHALIRTGLIVQTGLLLSDEGEGLGGQFITSKRMARLAAILSDVKPSLAVGTRTRSSRKLCGVCIALQLWQASPLKPRLASLPTR